MHFKLFSFVLFVQVISSVVCINSTANAFVKNITPYKHCFYKRDPIYCLKELALQALNETIMDSRPIVIGYIEIQKNPDYFVNTSADENLPDEVSERSSKLSDVLLDKLEEFFKSRTVKLNLSNAFEGKHCTVLSIKLHFSIRKTFSRAYLQYNCRFHPLLQEILLIHVFFLKDLT